MAAIKTIPRVRRPRKDPVYGADGSLPNLWVDGAGPASARRVSGNPLAAIAFSVRTGMSVEIRRGVSAGGELGSAAMPRAYWKGYLRLSLVTCPIELFPAATQAEKTHFHQINTRTGHRLRQQMVDEQTGQVVDAKHKGRGYELSKGHYVQIDEDELKAVEIESTHTVDITGFVPKADIDKRYLDKPYYITPQGKVGADAFAVIRDAMKDKDRVALAKIVIAHREHIIALEPLGKGLLGTTLRYDYEVRDEKAYLSDISSPRVSKDMIHLAAHILATKETRFDPRKFKDEYDAALKKLVRRKAKGHTIEEAPPPERPDNVINLMDALRESLGKKAAGSTSKGRSAKTKRARKVA
jgi:DNA end-binding protein Ku